MANYNYNEEGSGKFNRLILAKIIDYYLIKANLIFALKNFILGNGKIKNHIQTRDIMNFFKKYFFYKLKLGLVP